MHEVLPLLLLGSCPSGFSEALDRGCFVLFSLPDAQGTTGSVSFLAALEAWASGLPLAPVAVLCFHGTEHLSRLDEILSRLACPGREVYVVLSLPFGFEESGDVWEAPALRRGLSCARSVLCHDGRSLQVRLPRETTLRELFRIEGLRLLQLLDDLRVILAAPRWVLDRRTLVGTFRWEGTWPAPSRPTTHLATLWRALEEPGIDLLVCRGISDPERLLRMPRRLGAHPFLLCYGPDRAPRRLGAFVAVTLQELL